MDVRLAGKRDLPRLKAMFERIIRNMNANGVRIWNDAYPFEDFPEDIEKERLYLLIEDGEIAAAFALCDGNEGEGHVEWRNRGGKALYIDRFGVNVDYLRRGIGGLALEKAAALARERKAEYLRLFVVDINKPAINLYLKNGFTRAGGIYEERIDEDFVLREYGFEMEL